MDALPRIITSSVAIDFLLCLMLCCFFFKAFKLSNWPDKAVSFLVDHMGFDGEVSIENNCQN